MNRIFKISKLLFIVLITSSYTYFLSTPSIAEFKIKNNCTQPIKYISVSVETSKMEATNMQSNATISATLPFNAGETDLLISIEYQNGSTLTKHMGYLSSPRDSYDNLSIEKNDIKYVR